MELIRSKEFEDKMIDLVKTNWKENNKIRENIHLSDCLSPRQAYFKRKFPKEPTIEEILYFISGLSIEEGLLNLLNLPHEEVTFTNNIAWTPDFRFPGIVELKSRRSNLPKEGEETKVFADYIAQHINYCALDNSDNGALVVVSLAEKFDDSKKTKPVLAAYEVKYTKEELEEAKESLFRIKDMLEESLKTDDFSVLPLCSSWKCGKWLKKYITDGECLKCKRVFTNNYFLFRHKKANPSHAVEYAKVEYTFEPRCKWYDICKPEINKDTNEYDRT